MNINVYVKSNIVNGIKSTFLLLKQQVKNLLKQINKKKVSLVEINTKYMWWLV